MTLQAASGPCFRSHEDDPAPDSLREAAGNLRTSSEVISAEFDHDKRAQRRLMVSSRGQVLTAGGSHDGFEVGATGAYALDICKRSEIQTPAPGRRVVRFGEGANRPPAIALVRVRQPAAPDSRAGLQVYCSCADTRSCPHVYAAISASLGTGIEGLRGDDAARIQEDWREMAEWPNTYHLLRFLDRATCVSALVDEINIDSERARQELWELLHHGNIRPAGHQVSSIGAAMNRR